MCHKETTRALVRFITLVLAGTAGLLAQMPGEWRKVGGTSVDFMLAAPGTGPVNRVWFQGSTLFARTYSGRVFQTADFENWEAAAQPADPPPVISGGAMRIPENGSQVVVAQPGGSRIYALGWHLFRSDDGGRTWSNLTAFKSSVVVGPGQNSVAVSPSDPDQIVLANNFGVWRSIDGGLSWTGLNRSLPNLPVSRILSTPNGTTGTRVAVDRWGILELPPGSSIWQPATGSDLAIDEALKSKYSAQLGAEITAVGAVGRTVYIGASDGRLWASTDGGQTFGLAQEAAPGARVERIFVDPDRPMVALAARSGGGAHVLRTTNAGGFWDHLDGNLPDASVHGVTADRAAGAIYVATDKGIFWARTDLDNNSVAPVNWTLLSDKLPRAPARDVRLDPANVQLYAALDGYGVYAVAAPHRRRDLRIVNGGDFSTRPAAPGSLLTVVGGTVMSASGANLTYPVLAVVDNESQIQVPFEAVGPSVALALQTADGRVNRDIQVQPVSPAIMIGRDGSPMLWDADTGLPLDAKNTAHSNGRMHIWATGLGKVRPDWPSGMAAPENPPAVVAQMRVFLNRSPLQVTRATLVPGYVGFYLIEVQLPSINNLGPAELYISADGQESNRVQVVIEP